jgi:hypothetical protein
MMEKIVMSKRQDGESRSQGYYALSESYAAMTIFRKVPGSLGRVSRWKGGRNHRKAGAAGN